MSATAYQTTAKPRGRRESYSDGPERRSQSRLSSPPTSIKLSRSMSRTLDEVSVPRNSRPASPVTTTTTYRYVRVSDPRPPDPGAASSRQSASPLSSSKKPVLRGEDERLQGSSVPTTTIPPAMGSPRTSTSHLDAGQTMNAVLPLTAPSASGKDETTESKTPESTSKPPDVQSDSHGASVEITSPRSLASMQPTVTDETEDATDGHLQEVPPIPPIGEPQAAPSSQTAKVTSSAVSSDVAQDYAEAVTVTTASMQELPLVTASATSIDKPIAAPAPRPRVKFVEDVLELQSSTSKDHNAPKNDVPIQPVAALESQDLSSLSKVASPLASPVQSPTFYHATAAPLPPPPPPVSPPYMYPGQFPGGPPYQHAFYPPPFASPPAFMQPDLIKRSGSAGAEDERTRLLEKVSNVLPDINRLLHHYQETQGLLYEKDHLVKQVESQHEKEIAKLRIELSATKQEYERIIGEQAGENVRLKHEVAEHTLKLTYLQETSRQSDKIKQELSDLQTKYKSLEGEIQENKSAGETLKSENESLRKEIEDLKTQHAENQKTHDQLMMTLKETHAKEAAEKEQEHTKAINEHKANLSKAQLDLAGIINKHNQQKRDLDSARLAVSNQERSLAAKTKELKDAVQSHQDELKTLAKTEEQKLQKHREELAVWSRELARAISKHSSEMANQQEAHEKAMEKVKKDSETEHSKFHEDFERRSKAQQGQLDTHKTATDALKKEAQRARDAHEATKKELAKERETHKLLQGQYLQEQQAHTHSKTELENMQKNHEVLKDQRDAASKHHEELVTLMSSLKNKQAEWHRESAKMDKILLTLGQSNANKTSQGDQFYVGAFDHLTSLVEDISKRFFREDPIEVWPLYAVTHLIDFPNICGASPAAVGLRCLVVQHIIFSTLQRHIFQPLLFRAVQEDFDKDSWDDGLSLVSNAIRRKSFGREAVWRTITMQALHSGAHGRKTAQKAATAAIREIMEKVEPAVLPEEREALLRAVRLVAKKSVQVWRRARLEWDMIYSIMPEVLAPGGEPSPSEVLLWIRPHIVREHLCGWHGGGRGPTCWDEMEEEAFCVYLQGTALRQDSPLILSRRREIFAETGAEAGWD